MARGAGSADQKFEHDMEARQAQRGRQGADAARMLPDRSRRASLPGMPMAIRPARLEDIAAMHRIRLAVQENRLSPAASIDEPSYVPFITGYGIGWVAESEDAMLGFAILDTDTKNVWALFVDPAAESRGVGRALLDRLVAGAAERGLDRLWLTTAAGTRAETFYLRAGWVRAGPTVEGEVGFERSLR
jgi:GNAT superfamily N-acetyltransferase